MASPCPCGCGKSVSGFGVKRMAERAVYMQSLAAVSAHFAEMRSPTGTDPDPAGYKTASDFTNTGLGLSQQMLACAHRESYATPPPPSFVSEWEARALRVMREMARVDPDWLRQWTGPVRNRVTGKGGQ